MRFTLLISIVLIAMTNLAQGVDALLITKEGKSIVGYKVMKKGNVISYTAVTGKREFLELTDLYQVLPKVVRGHKYSPDQVAKYIKYTRKTMYKFTKLRKQMQPLMDEWLAIRRQFKELTPEAQSNMKKQINQMFATYAKSRKTDSDYNHLRGELEMLRYKDLQGVFEEIIDSRLQALGRVFVTRTLKKLKERCAKPKISVEEYREIDEFSKQLTSYMPPPEQVEQIKVALTQARDACVQTELQTAAAIFAKQKSLDGYLAANERISGLMSHVAEPRHNYIIGRGRKQMQGALAGYDFGVRGLRDFPVTSEDKALLSKIRPWISRPDAPLSDPAAIIFPTKFIPQIVMREDETILLRAIFCRKPPEGYLGVNIQPYDINVWNKTRNIKDARAEVQFSTATLRNSLQQSHDPNQKPDRIVVSLIVGNPTEGGSETIVLSNGSTFRLKH